MVSISQHYNSEPLDLFSFMFDPCLRPQIKQEGETIFHCRIENKMECRLAYFPSPLSFSSPWFEIASSAQMFLVYLCKKNYLYWSTWQLSMCLPHGGESSDLPCYQLPFSNTCLSDGQHHRHTALNREKETSLRGRVLSASFETNMSLSQLKPAKHRPIKIEPTETFFMTVCDFVMEVTESFACPFPDVKQTLQPSLPLSVPYCITPASSILPVFLYIVSPTHNLHHCSI